LISPVLELGVDHPVWESLPADPDSLQHAVAGQLVHHQVGVDHAGLLVGVGNHASGNGLGERIGGDFGKFATPAVYLLYSMDHIRTLQSTRLRLDFRLQFKFFKKICGEVFKKVCSFAFGNYCGRLIVQ
jgi:hypothetical protein